MLSEGICHAMHKSDRAIPVIFQIAGGLAALAHPNHLPV
ncbi:AAA family ATPase [Yersinia enterocolitica]|nr:AAA family ATPase [Yersinia enterocolitica]QBP99285.1 AAA family ATPase [Yersinia enterocolitica subsp. palearctica]EKN4926936.1 AAA family ATPase [Yersinia enterocolitica]EKN4931018.1 AAA family ATPase [Yersinia enterocolitica]EKN5013326.1 AAA family ATPase [Yersinia enterocolitica]